MRKLKLYKKIIIFVILSMLFIQPFTSIVFSAEENCINNTLLESNQNEYMDNNIELENNEIENNNVINENESKKANEEQNSVNEKEPEIQIEENNKENFIDEVEVEKEDKNNINKNQNQNLNTYENSSKENGIMLMNASTVRNSK